MENFKEVQTKKKNVDIQIYKRLSKEELKSFFEKSIKKDKQKSNLWMI